MKLPFFHLQLKKDRGEIASLLTIISVGLMIVGVFAGRKLATVGPQTNSKAAEPTKKPTLRTQAATLSGCNIVDTDLGPGCWCSQGDWQGHCFAGGKRGDAPSQLCRDNCSNKNGSAPAQNSTPAPTGVGGQAGSPTGANCSLKSSFLSPAVGDKCGNCVVFKSGGLEGDSLRKKFDDWGFSQCTNNQIVSYWCNGAVSEEGKNTCRARLAECKASAADCTGAAGADKYPLPGETAPTSPPPAGGAPDGGGVPKATATPDPSGTYGKYVVINTDSTIQSRTPIPAPGNYRMSITNGTSGLTFLDSGKNRVGDSYENQYLTYKNELSGNAGTTYFYTPENAPFQEIKQKTAESEIQGAEIQIGDILSAGFDVDNPKDLHVYRNQNLTLCNPYGKSFAESNLVPTITYANLIKNCKDQMNTLDLDFDQSDPLPTPTTNPLGEYAYYLFTVSLSDDTNTLTNPVIIKNIQIFPDGSTSATNAIVPVGLSNITLKKTSDFTPTFTSDIVAYKSDNIYTTRPIINPFFGDITSNGATYALNEKKGSIKPCRGTLNLTDVNSILGLCAQQNTNYQVPKIQLGPLTNFLSPTPIPTSTPDPTLTGTLSPPVTNAVKLTFKQTSNVVQSDLDNEYFFVLKLNKITLDGNTDITCNPKQIGDPNLPIGGTPWWVTDTSEWFCSLDNYPSDNKTITMNDVVLYVHADNLWDNPEKKRCLIASTPISIDNTKKLDSLIFDITTLVNSSKSIESCTIKLRSGSGLVYGSSLGSSNEAFQIAMTRWSNGEIGVLQMSAFISQLTRAPGLQITTCNPENGGCDF